MENNEHLDNGAKQWLKEIGMLLLFWTIALICVVLSILLAPILAGMPKK